MLSDACHQESSGSYTAMWHLLGNSPYEADQFAGNGHGHHIGVFASCHEASVTFTQPDLGFPTDVLDRFWVVFPGVVVSGD